MAEFEASRRMPSVSEIVFDEATDLRLLDRWIPQQVHVDAAPEELPVVHVRDDHAGASPGEREGLVRVDKPQLRMEWGGRGDDRYAGWLQVADSGAGASEVTVHLSIRDDEDVLQHADVDSELEDSLGRLYEAVSKRVTSP